MANGLDRRGAIIGLVLLLAFVLIGAVLLLAKPRVYTSETTFKIPTDFAPPPVTPANQTR